MSYKIDGRGSKPQRQLYNWLVELYPSLEVIYEQPLYELGQRIDLYIPNLGIAVEYNGEAHHHLISHFHKSIEDFKYGLELDRKKREYLYLSGIKCVDIDYNKMVKSKEELKELIESIPYPENIHFKPLPSNEKALDFKNKATEERKKKSSAYKVTENEELRKERLLKEKQFRQERYKKYKEARKK